MIKLFQMEIKLYKGDEPYFKVQKILKVDEKLFQMEIKHIFK
jgi:hypothetical protein